MKSPKPVFGLLNRLDVLDVEVAILVACHEVMLEVNLDNETLLGAQLLAERFARLREVF